MSKARDHDERARLEEEIRKPIRPRVIRPHGFAVPGDLEAINREKELMEELHQKAVAEAARDKLKLLYRRYSIAEDDHRGLALKLAVQHEPGFRVVDRQIADLPVDFAGPVRIKHGVLTYKRTGHPIDWPPERYLELLEAVQTEKKRSGATKDLDALKQLATKKEWTSPPAHRSKSPGGEYNARVRTLQSRLHDAKQFRRRLDALNTKLAEAERQLRK